MIGRVRNAGCRQMSGKSGVTRITLFPVTQANELLQHSGLSF